MTRPLLPFVLAVLVAAGTIAAAPPRAHARDAKGEQAAEHFSLAEAAEKRADWEAAILEYKQAYALKPHPDVLFMIAHNYERLEDWGNAAEFYQQYLDGTPNAPDRARVEKKIVALRAQAAAARPRPTAGGGRLEVYANVEGADVTIDGTKIGVTPFEGEVVAGQHELTLSHRGYHKVARRIYVQAGGTELVRERLERDGSSIDDPGDGTGAADARAHWGVGFSYGLNLTAIDQYRFAFSAGVQAKRLELNLLYGHFSRNDTAVGLDTRLYLAGDKMRPYVRGAISYGKMTIGTSYNAYTFGIEGGAGAVLSAIRTPTNTATQRSIRIEFYGEANARALLGGWAEGETYGDGGAMVSAEDAKQAFVVAIDFGLMYRW